MCLLYENTGTNFIYRQSNYTYNLNGSKKKKETYKAHKVIKAIPSSGVHP